MGSLGRRAGGVGVKIGLRLRPPVRRAREGWGNQGRAAQAGGERSADERETQQAQALIERERAKDARSKATAQQKQEAKRQERARQAAEEQAQRDVQRFERVQYGEVVNILKRSGAFRPFKTLAATGKGHMRGEYEALPSTVRSNKGRLDMDEAAAAIREEMPWLNIQMPDDLVQFFERHRDYRRNHSRLPEWWERRVV